jgi:hypothetical protein
MENAVRFVGRCMIMSAAIISGALIFHAMKTGSVGRFQYQSSAENANHNYFKFDTATGKLTYENR